LATPFGRYAVLIHSTPEIVLFAGDLEHNFIEVPLVAGPRQPPTDDVEDIATFVR
jgi:hypothetical protein